MDYTKLFYWLSVADNVKFFTGIITAILSIYMVTAIAAAIGLFESPWSEWEKSSKNVFILFSSIFFFTGFIWLFTPSKKDALLIIAGGSTMNFLTQDSTTKQLPHELSSYLITEIRSMANDANLKLIIDDNKQKIIEDAKQLTGKELIEKLQVDTILRNIILN